MTEAWILWRSIDVEQQMTPTVEHSVPAANPPRLSPEQLAWERFRANGVNVRAWAKERGFDPGLVYSVLRGERKCIRGKTHEVAVALGLKVLPN